MSLKYQDPFSMKVSVLLIMKCSSCKSRISDEQCPNKTLKGLIFCGKHARAKNTRLWVDVHNLNEKIIPIQKVWRGYAVRNRINLAGPGCLNRKICHNECELVSMEEKNSICPLQYFSFEESGKVYWFDIRSILEVTTNKICPENPYTRTPLTIETRQRLRKLCVKIMRSGTSITYSDKQQTFNEVLTHNWITICQIIVENGFFDMSPNYFMLLNNTQAYVFINLIRQDIAIWASEHKDKNSLRHKYTRWLKRLSQCVSTSESHYSSYLISKILLLILIDYPEPYPICFIIMSALHRL